MTATVAATKKATSVKKAGAKRTATGSRQPPVAHIVKRGGVKLAKAGKDVTALCGVTIRGDAVDGAPVCQPCVLKQLKIDDDQFGM